MTALVRMVSGLALWAFAFSVLYAIHGLGCALDWTGRSLFGLTQIRVGLIAVWLGLVLAQGALVVFLRRYRETHMDVIGIAIGWIGLFATIVGGVPILAISSCV